MSTKELIIMFYERNECAMSECIRLYGKYLYSIAYNIVGNKEDSEEIVNDALLKAWEKIPPDCPENIGGYLSIIVRNLSINKWKSNVKIANYRTEYDVVCDEFNLDYKSTNSIDEYINEWSLKLEINNFLKSESASNRTIFVERYYYYYPLKAIAKRNGMNINAVKSITTRMRKRLYKYLVERGVIDEQY